MVKVAGITSHGNMVKVRFTDDLVRRLKQFTKGGAERIDLIELPAAMSKVDALTYMKSHADFQSASDQATISDALADRVKGPTVLEVPKVLKVKVPKVKTPSLADIAARATTERVTDTV